MHERRRFLFYGYPMELFRIHDLRHVPNVLDAREYLDNHQSFFEVETDLPFERSAVSFDKNRLEKLKKTIAAYMQEHRLTKGNLRSRPSAKAICF
jgi:hypothetical protein